jgi:Glycosyltransferase family 92
MLLRRSVSAFTACSLLLLLLLLLVAVAVTVTEAYQYTPVPSDQPWRAAYLFTKKRFPLQNEDQVWVTVLTMRTFTAHSCSVNGVAASRVTLTKVDGESTRGRHVFSHRELVCTFYSGLLAEARQRGSRHEDAPLVVLLNEKLEVPVWEPPAEWLAVAAERPLTAVCTPTQYTVGHMGSMRERADRLRAEVGVDLFLMYASLNSSWATLCDLEQLHPRTVLAMRMTDSYKFQSHYHHQKQAQMDCMLRARALGVEWLLFLDHDEFLVWPAELPKSFAAVFDAKGALGVTFASHHVDKECCIDGGGSLAESMVLLKGKRNECSKSFVGHRKFGVAVGKRVPRVPNSAVHDPHTSRQHTIELMSSSGVFIQHIRGIMQKSEDHRCSENCDTKNRQRLDRHPKAHLDRVC